MSASKIINDPVHGFIEIPKGIILDLIDTDIFQRLRRIRQLAMSYLVYPGAIHSRFNHAIGAMHLTREALDALRIRGVEITDEEYEGTLLAILLHDIGQLAMFNQYPGLSRDALSLSLEENDGRLPYLSERKIFGFDHMDVGVELAKLWKFPSQLRAAISRHHTPYDYSKTIDTAVVVHAGNSVAVMAELDTENFLEVPPIDKKALEFLKLDDASLIEIAGQVRIEVEELLKVFLSN